MKLYVLRLSGSASRLLGMALVVLAACGRTELPVEADRPVLTRLVGAGDSREESAYSGEIRSRYETPLAFRIPGKIAVRLVDAGTQVKAGEVLARLDPADVVLSAAAASAQLELAEAEVGRYRELFARNFVSQAALDARETGYKNARAQADLARNQSRYSELRADHAGLVEQISVEPGQVVAAGQTVVRLVSREALEVVLAIPESRMPKMRSAKQAEIRLWSDGEARYAGVLRELSPVADAATRTYAARVSLLKPDSRVLLGMTARVRFLNEAQDEWIAIPMTAVFQHDGQPAVWVVGADRTVSLRPVRLKSFGDSEARVESGLQRGERIVVAGVHKLNAGQKIRPVERNLRPVE